MNCAHGRLALAVHFPSTFSITSVAPRAQCEPQKTMYFRIANWCFVSKTTSENARKLESGSDFSLSFGDSCCCSNFTCARGSTSFSSLPSVISVPKRWAVLSEVERPSSSIPFRQGLLSGNPLKSNGTVTLERFLKWRTGNLSRKPRYTLSCSWFKGEEL